MAKKEFTFQGKTLAELNEMSVKEFSELTSSRARRSLTRGIDKKLLRKITLAREKNDTKAIRTHKREIVIIPQMVGLTFGVYNGNEFISVEVKPEMLGHYLGEVALTRKKLKHGKAGIGATRSSTAISAK